MYFTDHDKQYQLTLAREVPREGMGMELALGGETKVLAEVFYSDAAREFSISLFEENLSLSVIEQLIGMAKIALVPSVKLHDR